MFSIEEIRENARATLLISSFATRTAVIILGLIIVLASSTALAGKSARGNPAHRHEFPRDRDHHIYRCAGLGPGAR
jgi:hypothetical protein